MKGVWNEKERLNEKQTDWITEKEKAGIVIER